ncbi:hypothetical protein [Streptomyces wuyuanensis]|uniref:hypothetical protein n=1 Tax=Streptomyces wuyuanensis TaxID=1196353 RepID=UPI00371F4352
MTRPLDATADPQRLGPVFGKHRHCFDRFAAGWDPPAEQVFIPYEGGSLPGYLFSPPGIAGALPIVIVNNGSDGPINAV